MERFFEVMEGPVGRTVRVLLGTFLIYLGLTRMSGLGSRVVAIVGLVPIAMGLWGPCLAHVAIRRFKRA